MKLALLGLGRMGRAVQALAVPRGHEVGFDSPVNTVTLCHAAHGLDGFASGALYAAEWIRGKEGVFEFSGILKGDAEA